MYSLIGVQKIIRSELVTPSFNDLIIVPEGKICQTILELYNKDGIVVEPAGAIGISALEIYDKDISNKNIGVLIFAEVTMI